VREGAEGVPAPRSVAESDRGFLASVIGPLAGQRESDSVRTVLVALGANLVIAVAKSIAAVVTRSASLTAEAAHSWADTGNEIFLFVANRRAARPPDRTHPFGYGREAYVWSLFAALGLFVAGGAISITHGVNELLTPRRPMTSSWGTSC
jgi:cation diffusion facilitator family transporter